MSLLNVTAGPLSNGSDTDGGAIVSNDIKTGQFQQGVDFDAFTFTGTTGNRVVMVAVATGAGSHNTQISALPSGWRRGSRRRARPIVSRRSSRPTGRTRS